MPDIFGSELKIGGAWKIDGAILTIEGGQDLVATGCSIDYSRVIADFLPINHYSRYLISGPGSGSVTIGALIGPSKSVKNFINTYSDICKTAGNTMVIKPAGVVACEGTDSEVVEFILGGCTMQGLKLDITNVGNMSMVGSTFSIKINSLTVK
jgi:hypothetical protein